MKVNLEGCAICGSTWGNYWAEIDGQRMFFCCEICFREFRNMIGEVKRRTSWKKIDSLDLSGDYRGREGTAWLGKNSYKYSVSFDSSGKVSKFIERR